VGRRAALAVCELRESERDSLLSGLASILKINICKQTTKKLSFGDDAGIILTHEWHMHQNHQLT